MHASRTFSEAWGIRFRLEFAPLRGVPERTWLLNLTRAFVPMSECDERNHRGQSERISVVRDVPVREPGFRPGDYEPHSNNIAVI